MRTTSRRGLSALVAVALASASVLAAAPAASAADDSRPPLVDIESPTETTTFGASGAWVTFTVTDDVAVSSWQVLVDGGHVISGSGAGRTMVNLFVGRLANGPHTVTVVALDTSGNETSASRMFGVSYDEPNVWITSPAADAWVRADRVEVGYLGSDSVTWTVRVDGTIVRTGAGHSGASFWHAPTGWVDGSTHTIEVTGVDAVGRTATRSVSFRADAAPPEVDVNPALDVLVPGSVLSGAVSDAASGVAGVDVSFARWVDGSGCDASSFGGRAVVSGGAWTLTLPGDAADGDYCVTATATDAVGNTRTSLPQIVTIDVTGPLAPTGLAPDGDFFDAPTALTWTADADAASYQYRIGVDADAMDDAPIVDVPSSSVVFPAIPPGTLYWQVRGIDEFGNIGDWSALAHMTVLGAPELVDCGNCRLVGGLLHAEWSAYPGASAYHLEITGTDADGDQVVVAHEAAASETEANVTLPSSFPTGTIAVRMRVELDQAVEGRTLTDWSTPLTYLRFTEPRQPGLLSPATGAYVDGDAVTLEWTDDSSVILWELRLSTSSTLGGDGGLTGTHPDTAGPLVDPMIMTILLAGIGSDIPEGLVLDEFDAEADCQLLQDLLGSLEGGEGVEIPCADGSYTIPSNLPDGAYFWQVRGISFTSLMNEDGLPGPWSSVGRFSVGEAPAPAQPGSPSQPAGNALQPGPRAQVAPTAGDGGDAAPDLGDQAPDAPSAPDEGSGEDSRGGDAAPGPEVGDTTPDAGDGFPAGLIIGGIVALVVLAGGGALVVSLLRRR